MTLQELLSKKVAVLGFGMEGRAVTRWLLNNHITPVIFDQKPIAEWTEDEAQFIIQEKLNITSGPSYMEGLEGFDVVFRSPGIWRLHPLLLNLEKQGTIITSQARWFLEHCPATIVGVTGTKGKGTTSSLIHLILSDAVERKAYRASSPINQHSKIYLTGNIGKVQPLEIIDGLTEHDVVVYELSSFQLQDISKSPRYAVVLMITQDHLDHHQNIEEYHRAKQNIVSHQTAHDFAVINQDYPASELFKDLTTAHIAWVSAHRAPTYGAHIRPDNSVYIYGFSVPNDTSFVKLEQLQLKGKHNLQNVSAAVLVALQMDIAPESIEQTITTFTGLEHRLQKVATVQGVSYYDDSFSTVPETTIAAINAFTEPIILILGGSEKNSDFAELAQTIVASKNIKALILIGQTAPRISDALKNAGGFGGSLYKNARTMDHIFEQVHEVAEAGDVVVLSPACASFDMFPNYKERGNQFIAAARAREGKA